jgi:hypothetical protein
LCWSAIKQTDPKPACRFREAQVKDFNDSKSSGFSEKRWLLGKACVSLSASTDL